MTHAFGQQHEIRCEASREIYEVAESLLKIIREYKKYIYIISREDLLSIVSSMFILGDKLRYPNYAGIDPFIEEAYDRAELMVELALED